MILNRFKIVLCSLLIFTTNAHANSLEEFYKHFKSGQYAKAIEALEQIPVEGNSLSSKAYFAGLSYSKMQEYDKAIVHFETAIAEKNESLDLYYEYGQALYAANELKKSRDAFKISADKKFNRPASLYYVAHISQILEDFEMARDYYTLVIKDKNSDVKMKQISHFQLAETLLSIAREKSKNPEDLLRRVDKFILPMMTKAYDFDKASNIAIDIAKRTAELMQEFNLDPNMLSNGRRINPKRYSGSIGQKIKFDDNISLTNEENNTQQTKKESYIFETEFYGRYDFIIKKKFIISPEVRFTFTEHADQKSPEVYQNDSFIMNFNLKNKYEHKYKDQPASFIFDIDHSRTSRDSNQRKKREYYASSTTFTFGESFTYFEIGDTSIKYKKKDYEGENTAINNHTNSFSLDQTFFLQIQHLVIALFEMSFIDNYNNSSTNTDTYLFRIDYLIPEIFPQYTLGLATAYTITDTKQQELTRGTETSINPSIDFSKQLNPSTKIAVNYDFTKNKSKDANYSYSKHVTSAEIRFSF